MSEGKEKRRNIKNHGNDEKHFAGDVCVCFLLIFMLYQEEKTLTRKRKEKEKRSNYESTKVMTKMKEEENRELKTGQEQSTKLWQKCLRQF